MRLPDAKRSSDLSKFNRVIAICLCALSAVVLVAIRKPIILASLQHSHPPCNPARSFVPASIRARFGLRSIHGLPLPSAANPQEKRVPQFEWSLGSPYFLVKITEKYGLLFVSTPHASYPARVKSDSRSFPVLRWARPPRDSVMGRRGGREPQLARKQVRQQCLAYGTNF